MELKRRYVLDEEEKRVAVQLDIDTFEKLERVLEDYGLAKLIEEEDDGEMLSLDEAKRYYDTLPKASLNPS